MSDVEFSGDGAPSPLASQCEPDDGGLLLPDGFCAIQVTADLQGVRHLTVAGNGDVFVSRENFGGDGTGGVTVLRDTDGDGRADLREDWGTNGGNDVLLRDGYAYHSPKDAVLRYPLEPGSMVPSGPPDTIVGGLPSTLNHGAKSLAISRDGDLFVSIGAHGNACMEESRTPGSPGMDPCPILETRGGIWRFDADAVGQTQEDGERFATGIRNVMALGIHPGTDSLYAIMHGRDQLHQLWPDFYTEEESAENPAEQFFVVTEGSDFGWPFCYYDAETGRKVLNPEYGGDGERVGRCSEKDMPFIGFPAHWAPNDLEFYTGDQFPGNFRGGAFVAFHGSWNRAPLPQEGFNVVFVPADGRGLATEWSVFADGFRIEGMLGTGRTLRPVGVAMGPDGSLYVSDSAEGTVWRILYSG